MCAVLFRLAVAATILTVFGPGSSHATRLTRDISETTIVPTPTSTACACTPTETRTPFPTPTATLVPCLGDCNANGVVTIAELVLNVGIALGSATPSECPASTCSGSPAVLITCLIEMVDNALNGCRTFPAPTSTPISPYSLSGLHDLCGEDSGDALLARVRPEYSGTVTPRPEAPWTAPFSFTLQLTFRGGTITCYPAFVPPPGGRETPVPAHVGVVLEVQFITANGAFAETVDTELGELLAPGYAYVDFSRRPNEIQGTYRPDLPGYHDDVLVDIAATLRGDSATGVIALRGTPLGQGSDYILIANWQGAAPPN